MINLCNDVLNKERRNLFPKIHSLDNKLSLYSLIFLKKQNPIKFYKSFYDKILKKTKNKKEKKPEIKSSYLSLLSKSQNYFYSLPIKYNFKPEKTIIKYNDNHQNNNINNIMTVKKENSILNKSDINQIDILQNKNLKKIHEYLVKNKNNNYLNKRKQHQSCKEISMENSAYNSDNENSIINDKISRGQQTVSNGPNFYENEKNEELEKIKKFEEKIFHKNNNKKLKYKIKNKEKINKFTIVFKKNKSQFDLKNNHSRTNKINIIWRNLRRPISMNFNSSLKYN